MRPRIGAIASGWVARVARDYGLRKQAAARLLLAIGWLSVERGIGVEDVRKAMALAAQIKDPTRSQSGSGTGPTLDPERTKTFDTSGDAARAAVGTKRALSSSASSSKKNAEAGTRFLLAWKAGHRTCCLDEWELGNCPSIARRLASGERVTDKQLSKVEAALDKANACELAKRSGATANVPSKSDQRAKVLADLEHHREVMRERAEDGLPQLEEHQERLRRLDAMAARFGGNE